MTTQAPQQAMPEMIVDRSPELARGARSLWFNGPETTITTTTLKAEGARGDGARCALARVILATWNDVAEAHIEGERPYLIFKDGQKVPFYMVPDMAEWIGRFDRGENPDPVEITLER